MGHDETLVDLPGVSSCPVCGSGGCAHFHAPPHPADYPLLPGGYDPDAEATVDPVPRGGARARKGMRWRS
jgi:hypothetical protein